MSSYVNGHLDTVFGCFFLIENHPAADWFLGWPPCRESTGWSSNSISPRWGDVSVADVLFVDFVGKQTWGCGCWLVPYCSNQHDVVYVRMWHSMTQYDYVFTSIYIILNYRNTRNICKADQVGMGRLCLVLAGWRRLHHFRKSSLACSISSMEGEFRNKSWKMLKVSLFLVADTGGIYRKIINISTFKHVRSSVRRWL